MVGRMLTFARAAEIFTGADQICYAILPESHREPMPVASQGFRDWLTMAAWRDGQTTPSLRETTRVAEILTTWSRLAGSMRPVGLRVAEANGCLYLDLGDASGQAVEIDTHGWRLVDTPPMVFRRPSGMKPLPAPARGGSIKRLRRHIRTDEDGLLMAIAWLLAALRPKGPYPMLYLLGSHGAAKSWAMTVLKTLIDPEKAMRSKLPTVSKDLYVVAQASHVPAFDNVSRISDGISDTLCTIATGSSHRGRKLFTDQEESVITVQRPMLMNGIIDAVGRPDLSDRLFRIELERVPDEERRPEAELRRELERDHPLLLGALLDIMVVGLRNMGDVRRLSGERMIDAAHWAQACAPAFSTEERLVEALQRSRKALSSDMLSTNPVARAILELADERGRWTGTATDLLSEVVRRAPPEEKLMPQGAAQLKRTLNRIETDLRAHGLDIEDRRVGRRGDRVITIILRAPPADARGTEDG
ncbi:hypothetical protein CCR87_08035 [Rhodobaculum claviforme]|uniref:ATP-binding protein n=2 Tax=Rhodobaculum claviforme TaxID=1549854 RepID=A0A934WHK2_9RHOB|nr:hypothetical protein [Rhodobaculum claviforme]